MWYLLILGAFGNHYEHPSSSLKNREADMTNPNIYHSIDEKIDHVYDEIKQNDVKGNCKKFSSFNNYKHQ